MVLHRSNFDIPARFCFRPFSVRWEVRTAELMDWWEPPKSNLLLGPPIGRKPESEWVSVRIDPSGFAFGGLSELTAHTVQIHRKDIPRDVLNQQENCRNTLDISGRHFTVLVGFYPESNSILPQSKWKPDEKTKNAWIMRDEFLNLSVSDESEWPVCLKQFLNKWGLWSYGIVFDVSLAEERPGFVLEFPHLLSQKRTEYRKALQLESARKWLSTANPLFQFPHGISAMDKWPHFLVERSYCEDAIRATITIDHLAERKFGICERCHELFEKETKHKKRYCSESCINAANVKQWRDRHRKGEQRNAKG
jgi:hypothetical protein